MPRLFRKKEIAGCEARGDQHSVYLTRWTLFQCALGAVYLHRFHRSDADELHDHPWSFVSLILWRGYDEEVFKQAGGRERLSHGPGKLLFRSAGHAHRVILRDGRQAWTLVIRGPYVREWGFFTARGWQLWTEYFRQKGC